MFFIDKYRNFAVEFIKNVYQTAFFADEIFSNWIIIRLNNIINFKTFMKMKKYLMTGIAALALCAGFTSCSHDLEPMSQDEIDQMEAKKTVETYKKAFEAYVGGKVAANQTWGFSGSFAPRTRGTFSNGNEWAANDRTDCMYKVPPVLYTDQIKIVRIYFQSVEDPSYEDPEWTDYFIQQVYKGGDNPGPNSTEKYKAADGQTDIIGSDHMDHLAAIDPEQTPEFVDHNKNFNHGDCGVYTNVLNYKGTLTTVEETYPVNSGDEYRHPDKINLMTNSTTKSFGYYNSNSSIRRTEYTGLVSWETIKRWADANGHAGEADCLNDGWNRSFMGFDFEMLIDKDVYAVVRDENRTAENNYQGDIIGYDYFYVMLPNGNEEVWNGTELVDASTVGVIGEVYGNKVLYPYFPGTTEKVTRLSDNSNQYAGTPDTHTWTDADWEYYDGDNTKHLSIVNMTNALRANKLPRNDKSWITIGGTADHYYSDWIVTLTKAEKYSTPTPPTPPTDADLRVMAEDLTLGSTDEDFDFNDIVFDVYYTTSTSPAKVKIKAAGGTLQLRITKGDENPATDADWAEVHDLFQTANPSYACAGKMINTQGTNSDKPANVRSRSLDGLTEPDFIELNFSVTTPADAKKIKIQVLKGTVWTDIEADQGQPAAKIAVPATTDWCEERVSIKSAYPSFAEWATRNPNIQWWAIE